MLESLCCDRFHYRKQGYIDNKIDTCFMCSLQSGLFVKVFTEYSVSTVYSYTRVLHIILTLPFYPSL